MNRIYADPIDVWPPKDATPARFVWRGQLHTVNHVVEHWASTRDWWRDDTSLAAGENTVREFWRVQATADGAHVADFELRLDHADGQWLLCRAADPSRVVMVETFGYLHGPAPEADLTVDLQTHFRDPHYDPAMRQMTAEDSDVRAAVLATPGIYPLLEATQAAVNAYLAGPAQAAVRVAIGCDGGRHSAPTFGRTLARMLEASGVTVNLTHRDMATEVVDR